ncbi:TonB C-terminal domain-containing protein [Campylobacter sp. RM16188]|uniref:TonB C-terminal domain-containing protein n=1 Tax=Campylobacter sp. RM16188 TaxID=1705725 RepID=UPI0015551356|nr:TonB C-terminal domain-containing protein [Campylobacter sp. RM16188]
MDKILKPNFNTFNYFILSFVLYICMIVGIFVKLTYFEQEAKRYTDTKDAFMDITIVEREPDIVVKAPEKKEEVIKSEEPEKKVEQPKEESKPDTTNKPVEPEVVPEAVPEPKPVEKEEPNLKDLFKDIDTSKLKEDKVVKKKETPKDQSRIKPEKKEAKKEAKAASDVINSLQLDKVAKTPKSQRTGEYNPYAGEISRILETKWTAYKADSNDNAKVEISIDVNGNFSYNIKQLSYNSEFNDKVREFLQKMTFEKFPPSQLGRPFVFETTLLDKIEN